jgi:regulatory protein
MPSLRVQALQLLARREHTREELRRALTLCHAEPEAIEALLDEFQRKGWLSESRLIEQMVAKARGRYGLRRVLDRLQQKGATDETLDEAALAMKAQELDSAKAVWRKRFGQPPANLTERARQARFLAGRGFSRDVIRAVLGRQLDESE